MEVIGQSLPPPEILNQELENPGLAIESARKLVGQLVELDSGELNPYMELLPRVYELLSLSQSYEKAIELLEWIDRLRLDESVAQMVPETFGQFSFAIPEFYLNLGDSVAARAWLTRTVPLLTDAQDTYRAAVLLGRVLVREARPEQARQILGQRFYDARLQKPPFLAEGLLAYIEANIAMGDTSTAQEALSALFDLYPNSLEYQRALTLVENPTQALRVHDFPSPGSLLQGADQFALGLVPFRPIRVEPEPDTETEPQSALESDPRTTEGEETKPEVVASSDQGFIQVGNFTSPENAQRMADYARDRGFDVQTSTEGSRIRVLVPLIENNATRTQLLLKEAGIEGFYVSQ